MVLGSTPTTCHFCFAHATKKSPVPQPISNRDICFWFFTGSKSDMIVIFLFIAYLLTAWYTLSNNDLEESVCDIYASLI